MQNIEIIALIVIFDLQQLFRTFVKDREVKKNIKCQNY